MIGPLCVSKKLSKSMSTRLPLEGKLPASRPTDDCSACVRYPFWAARAVWWSMGVEGLSKFREQPMAIISLGMVPGTSLREVKTALLNNWQGCMMTKNGFYVSRKYENIEINDRVGGGDSFASGLIWGMLEGHDEQEIIDFATAFSALCHTIRNDWNLVTREEAEALANGGSARVKR